MSCRVPPLSVIVYYSKIVRNQRKQCTKCNRAVVTYAVNAYLSFSFFLRERRMHSLGTFTSILGSLKIQLPAIPSFLLVVLGARGPQRSHAISLSSWPSGGSIKHSIVSKAVLPCAAMSPINQMVCEQRRHWVISPRKHDVFVTWPRSIYILR
jgi:hypothetical protein